MTNLKINKNLKYTSKDVYLFCKHTKSINNGSSKELKFSSYPSNKFFISGTVKINVVSCLISGLSLQAQKKQQRIHALK